MRKDIEVVNELPKEHSRYGMASLHLTNSSGSRLVASDLVHGRFVVLRIWTSSHQRKLNADHWFQGRKLIEVSMSQTQFAELVSSFNTEGVPCTLEFVAKGGTGVLDEPIPVVDKTEQHKREFADSYQEVVSRLRDLSNRLETAIDEKAGKKVLREIAHELDVISGNFRSNTNFAINQFNEAVEDRMNIAKAEMKAFLNSLGTYIPNMKDIPAIGLSSDQISYANTDLQLTNSIAERDEDERESSEN